MIKVLETKVEGDEVWLKVELQRNTDILAKSLYTKADVDVLTDEALVALAALDEAVTPSPVPSSGGLMEATAAQHIGRNGKPAQFTRNGILETCQCRECRTLSARPSSPKGGAETQPRAGGIGVDWWAESVKLYRQNQKLRKALKEQHDWHLTTINVERKDRC